MARTKSVRNVHLSVLLTPQRRPKQSRTFVQRSGGIIKKLVPVPHTFFPAQIPGSASNTGARRARKDRNINCPGHKIYNYLINRKDKQQGREQRGGHSIHVRCQLEWPHCRCGEGKGCQIRVGASE